MSHHSQIHFILKRLIEADSNDYGDLYDACDDLYNVLIQLAGIDILDERNSQHLLLDSGSAIGLNWAALCIKDLMRTKKFVDAIIQATSDLRKSIKGRAINILYVGTGPFATLLLPLTTLYGPDQVRFFLVEVNEASFNCLQKMAGTLGLEKYISQLENTDAAKWKLPSDLHVDLFICEAIQQGLRNEPQVDICLNILPQLPPNSIIIPEEITLQAALINIRERIENKLNQHSSNDHTYLLGNILKIDREAIVKQVNRNKQSIERIDCFPPTSLKIPLELVKSHPALCVLTEILVYNQERLLLDESPLTIPLKLTELGHDNPSEIEFQYHPGKNPGIRFSFK